MSPAARVTLDVVAARAGVSKATVSKVFNHRPGVGEAARARVEAALLEAGYRTTTHDRPGAGRAWVCALFDTLVNQYSLSVLEGLVAAAQEHDVMLVPEVLAPGASSSAPPPAAGRVDPARIERLAAQGCAGLIAVTTHLDDDVPAAARAVGLPLVAIDPPNPLDDRVASVGATDWAGGVQATRHLIDLGHRRIAHLGGPFDMPTARGRYLGYREALEDAGLPLDPALVLADGMYTGRAMARTVLDLPDPPTAVFAAFDFVAIDVAAEALGRGLSVPGDLSIVGYDDTYARILPHPQLTSVHSPLYEMGRVGLRTVRALAAGEAPDAHHVQLATTLTVRTSTAPPRQRPAATSLR